MRPVDNQTKSEPRRKKQLLEMETEMRSWLKRALRMSDLQQRTIFPRYFLRAHRGIQTKTQPSIIESSFMIVFNAFY